MSKKVEISLGSELTPLALEVYKLKDRYQHTVSDEQGFVWFRSVDSTDFITPLFTELHVQGELLFLSGHADNCYWSMSISESRRAPMLKGILFDVACRTATEFSHKQVGSLYSAPFNDETKKSAYFDLDSPNALPERSPTETAIYPDVPDTELPITLHYKYEIFPA